MNDQEAGFHTPLSNEELEAIAKAEDLAFDIQYAKTSAPADVRTHEQVLADEYEEGMF